MPTIPDSNVVLDLIREGQTWQEWSSRWFKHCLQTGGLVINQVVFAECGQHHGSLNTYADLLENLGLEREEIPWEAAYLAGQAQRIYRQSGGMRERVLPDFLIGAHAQVKGFAILTRDQNRYRSYFPNLQIIAPDTHP